MELEPAVPDPTGLPGPDIALQITNTVLMLGMLLGLALVLAVIVRTVYRAHERAHITDAARRTFRVVPRGSTFALIIGLYLLSGCGAGYVIFGWFFGAANMPG